MAESTLLLAETNPYGTLEALVEDDGRTVYLYLQPAGDQPGNPCAVWVANRLPAPVGEDRGAMQAGMAPLMPRGGTRHPEGHPPLEPGRLAFVWLEEGDGVALLEGDRPLAVLPPWSGMEGFWGYAAEAARETPLAWPLEPALPGLAPRLEAARGYWEWRGTPGSWPEIRDGRMAHMESRLGPHRRYWAADGGTFPPRAIALFTPEEVPGVSVLATVGMSAQAMPRVELAMEDPAPHRRVELVLGTRGEPESAAGLLSGLMIQPWRARSWFGGGHTYSWEPLSEEPGRSAVLLTAEPPPNPCPPPSLDGLRDRSGDPVTFLWVLPITAAERTLAAGSGSASLARKLARERRGWLWSQPAV